MAFDNTNRGALFKNTEKSAENHPDYKGNLNASGVEYWVSAWIKKSKDGKTYMSLSVVPKDTKAAKAKAIMEKAPAGDDDLGDAPF